MVRSIEPMTLENMRANCVRTLAIRCISEAEERLRRQTLLKYNKATPAHVTHAIQLIEEMRDAALDSV